MYFCHVLPMFSVCKTNDDMYIKLLFYIGKQQEVSKNDVRVCVGVTRSTVGA